MKTLPCVPKISKQHTLEVGVHEAPVEAELLGVALHHITVRLVDPYRLDVALVSAFQDPAYVAVRETGYYDSHRPVSEILHKKYQIWSVATTGA